MIRSSTFSLFILITFFGCDIIEKDDVEPVSFGILRIENDQYNTIINQPIFLDFLRNDSFNSEVTLQISEPVHGVLRRDSLTRFIYHPAIDFVGEDYFEYTICNYARQCEKGIIEIYVAGAGSPELPEITEPAILRWTGEYEVDGCGFIIIIGTEEYKADNESFINEKFKLVGESNVLLTYRLLEKGIEVNCGDRPDPLNYKGIEVIEIK